MKKTTLLLVGFLSLLITLNTFGFSKEKYQQIEDNLLVGINTENRGLQISCAFFLGELRSERAVIPLLKMLKSGETEEERIIAALSLSKIDSEKGLFAVKRSIQFDDSERVQRLCSLFYNCCMKNKSKGEVIVEPLSIDLSMEFNGMKLSDFSN
jgi:hypothetical protein